MGEVHQLPDINRVEQEAAEWIARLNSDQASQQDRERFTLWRASHASRARVYDEMSATMQAFQAAGAVVRAVSFGQSMNEAAKPPRAGRRWRLVAPIAAAVALATVAALYMLDRRPGNRLETAFGEHGSMTLADGSTIELNSNSSMQTIYSEHARVIQLQRGEAFFKVAPDPARPFWVLAGGSWVRALGTAFNVDVRPREVRITVSEGAVQIGPAAASGGVEPVELDMPYSAASRVTAGQQAEVEKGGADANVRALGSGEIGHSLGWLGGKVHFDKQPLGAVVEEMERYTPTRLIISDERLRQLEVGGTFPSTPQGVDMLIAMLRDGFGLSIRRESDRIYIEDAQGSTSRQVRASPGTP